MRIQLLDNITGEWSMQWIIVWFICGVIALSAGFGSQPTIPRLIGFTWLSRLLV